MLPYWVDVGAYEVLEEEEGDEKEENLPHPIVRKPVRPATKRRIDYTRSGMTRKVKR